MDKFMVTLGTGTGMGQIQQCCTQTATINGKPIATMGAIASHPYINRLDKKINRI